ncbi:MAG TPA: ATP-binding protein [Anaeromyxobacter sp.]|nr:ATP-binding protein [Anaeromyxobacter sp.]
MTGKRAGKDAGRLRERAEARLGTLRETGESPLDLEGSLRLVQELRVHQIELELQNEELRSARDELEASLTRYEDLYDFAPVGYLTVDAGGTILELNLAAATLLGRERAALSGADFANYLPAAERDGFRTFLAAALVSDVKLAHDLILGGLAPGPVPVHLEGLAAGLQGREAGRCRMVLVDLTEERRLESRLRLAQKLEAVALLAAGVAHEINNPLAYLIQGMRELQEDLASPALDLTKATGIVTDGLDGLLRIRDIVRSLKVASDPETTQRAPVDASEELGSALRLAAGQLRDRARVVTHLAPLPWVSARPRELGQAFLNLLLNAAQACPEGGADRHQVTVSSHTDASGWAVVEVTDTGSGMAPAVLERLFEPFFTTKPQGVGTGLGLAQVRASVTAAGGRVEVASAPAAGSTFRVLLPPATGAGFASGARVLDASPVAVPVAARKLRVLVVDDEPMVARSVARALGTSCLITVSASGEEGLSRLERGEAFDAVVCDMTMPAMSGRAFQAIVQARWPELGRRFLFLTGSTLQADGTELRAPEGCVVVEKPFDGAELRALVERLGSGH